jgi:acetylornithine deacetylase/succinyl-diaminopimelate desuccinylase-like protein
MDPILLDQILDFAITVQQIPAPTFSEERRALFLYEQFQNEELDNVSLDYAGNVYGRLAGEGVRPPLVVSAHLDTVFPASMSLPVRQEHDKIYGPGIGDNSLGVAGLLGLLWALRQREIYLPGDIWLVANAAEEGLGDLRGMRAVVDRFGGAPLAYLVLEGMALGQVYHRALGSQRYRIRVRTAGGHSWVDYGRPSAVHELAELITRLTALPLPTRQRTSLNVGVIGGGTTVNTIAAEAFLELDLRSEAPVVLKDLVETVELMVQDFNQPGVQVSAEVIGRRPAGKLPTRHPLAQLARRCLEAEDVEANFSIGSTDANIPLSRGLPSICVGLSTGGNAHTVHEFINKRPLAQGMRQLLGLVKGAFQEL